METDNQLKTIPSNFEEVATMMKMLKREVAMVRSDSQKSTNEMRSRIEDMIGSMKQLENRFKEMVTNCESTLSKVVDEVKDQAIKKPSFETKGKEYLEVVPGGITRHSEAYIWTITDIGLKLRHSTFECKTEVFPLQGYHFGAQAKLYVTDENRVLMWISFVDYKNTEQPIGLKSFPKVTFIVCDMVCENEIRDVVRTCDCDFKESIRYEQFYYGVYLPEKSRLLYPTYNIYDSMKIKILVEPPFLAKRFASTDGNLTWTIDNYRKKKEMEKEELVVWQESPYFYTSPNGYRVQLLLRLNGYNESKGAGLTAYVWFITGENDATLGKSFAHKTSISVTNHEKFNSHLIKSVEKATIEKKGYYVELETHDFIENGGFIKDDSLELNICIGPI